MYITHEGYIYEQTEKGWELFTPDTRPHRDAELGICTYIKHGYTLGYYAMATDLATHQPIPGELVEATYTDIIRGGTTSIPVEHQQVSLWIGDTVEITFPVRKARWVADPSYKKGGYCAIDTLQPKGARGVIKSDRFWDRRYLVEFPDGTTERLEHFTKVG